MGPLKRETTPHLVNRGPRRRGQSALPAQSASCASARCRTGGFEESCGAGGCYAATAQTPPATTAGKTPERLQPIYAEPGTRAFHALTMVWPLACRRLEGFPNITSTQLFEEPCIQFPGRFHPWQVRRLMKRVKVWRRDARPRGVVIDRLKYRCVSKKPRGRGPGPQRFVDHWPEMLQCLEAQPDLTAAELLTEFQARYPGFYKASVVSRK